MSIKPLNFSVNEPSVESPKSSTIESPKRSPKELPKLPIIRLTPDEMQDSNIDAKSNNQMLPKGIGPMSGREVVRIRKTSPRSNIARTSSSKDFKPGATNFEKTKGWNEMRKTSGVPIRRKDTLDEQRKDEQGVELQLSKEKHFRKSEGSKTDRRRGQKPSDTHPIRSIVVPFSTFIKAIDIPVISYGKWEKNVRRSIACQVLDSKFSDVKMQVIINDIYDRLLDSSSILRRIDCARFLLFGIEEHRYLKHFSGNSTPIHFWDNYVSLEKKSPLKCKDFYEIIGKEGPLKIVKTSAESNGSVMKEKIQSEMNLVLFVERKKNLLLKSSFSFAESFDTENLHIVPIPIYLLDYQEFSESFRSHLSDGPFLADCIRVNGKNLIIPNYKELGVKEEDREVCFLRWLILRMQQEIDIESKSSVDDQIKLFQENWDTSSSREDSLKLKKAIRKCFKNEFRIKYTIEEIPAKLEACFKKLQKHENGRIKFFSERMLPHLRFVQKYLIAHQGFKSADWDLVSYDLTSLCRRFDFLELKQKKIPLLALLKSMCYSSYSTGELLMRETLCPNLSRLNASPYHLIFNRDSMMNYDIWYEFNCFEVAHIKMFNIVSNGAVKANVQVHWIPKGKLDSIEYTSSLEFSKFDFLPDCSYEERKVILDLFNIDFDNSPWGKYLRRGDINDCLIGPKPTSEEVFLNVPLNL